MSDLFIANVRPDAKASANILIENGRISGVGSGLVPRPGMAVIDGKDAIAIAPFVESHVHLDKILWGLPWHSINVPQSLRAMIDNLMKSLPEVRHPALLQERELLDRAIDRLYALPEDAALARIPDTQGIGGASHR